MKNTWLTRVSPYRRTIDPRRALTVNFNEKKKSQGRGGRRKGTGPERKNANLHSPLGKCAYEFRAESRFDKALINRVITRTVGAGLALHSIRPIQIAAATRREAISAVNPRRRLALRAEIRYFFGANEEKRRRRETELPRLPTSSSVLSFSPLLCTFQRKEGEPELLTFNLSESHSAVRTRARVCVHVRVRINLERKRERRLL